MSWWSSPVFVAANGRDGGDLTLIPRPPLDALTRGCAQLQLAGVGRRPACQWEPSQPPMVPKQGSSTATTRVGFSSGYGSVGPAGRWREVGGGVAGVAGWRSFGGVRGRRRWGSGVAPTPARWWGLLVKELVRAGREVGAVWRSGGPAGRRRREVVLGGHGMAPQGGS